MLTSLGGWCNSIAESSATTSGVAVVSTFGSVVFPVGGGILDPREASMGVAFRRTRVVQRAGGATTGYNHRRVNVPCQDHGKDVVLDGQRRESGVGSELGLEDFVFVVIYDQHDG